MHWVTGSLWWMEGQEKRNKALLWERRAFIFARTTGASNRLTKIQIMRESRSVTTGSCY